MVAVVIRRAAAGVLASVVCTGLLSAPPAAATTGEELTASEAAQVVAEAVAVEGVPAATDAAEVTQSSQGVVADVPNSPVSLVLPDAEVTGQSGTATVVAGVGDSQAVVQDVGAQGQRVAFIINAPTDPTEYRVDFDGAATLEMDSTGAVRVLDAHSQLLALVSPPWARDANGTEVPTRFVVEGTTLTQVVEHKTGAFAYPIAADPNVVVGFPRSYARFSKSEVQAFARSPLSGKIKYLALGCLAVPTSVAKAICGYYIYDNYNSVATTFADAARLGRCVELGYITSNGYLVSWRSYSC